MLARATLAALPEVYAAHLGDVVLRIEELADVATLAALEIAHPLDLTGLYEGTPIGDKERAEPGAMPDRITLYRRAILDEWVEGRHAILDNQEAEDDEIARQEGEDFAILIHHIVIHEVGHHFGLDDDAIHALEDAAG